MRNSLSRMQKYSAKLFGFRIPHHPMQMKFLDPSLQVPGTFLHHNLHIYVQNNVRLGVFIEISIIINIISEI